MVHGTEEVYSVIRTAVLTESYSETQKPRNTTHQEISDESAIPEEILETSVNGVWSLSLDTRLFAPNFEAVKVIEHTICI